MIEPEDAMDVFAQNMSDFLGDSLPSSWRVGDVVVMFDREWVVTDFDVMHQRLSLTAKNAA